MKEVKDRAIGFLKYQFKDIWQGNVSTIQSKKNQYWVSRYYLLWIDRILNISELNFRIQFYKNLAW